MRAEQLISPPPESFDMHVAIIGAYGSAGVAAAQVLADREEVELTLIDGGDPGGGLCILRGCMPSKEVYSAGAHRFQARHDDRLSGTPAVDLETVIDRKNDHIEDFAAHRRAAVHDLADREGVEFIGERARLGENRQVAVGEREIDADYVLVATGSKPNVPDLPELEAVPYATSDEVLDATDFGESGIVMGFGYVGVEMAPYLAEVGGMDLTVIEHDARPLDEADDVFGDAMMDLYRGAFGIDVRTNVAEQSIESDPDGEVRLNVEHESGREERFEAEELFVFTGRRPALPDGVEEVGLDPGPGWVDETMQTSENPRVFVVGDANGREPVLHVAKEQGFLAAENLLRHDRGEDLQPYENTHHHVIFSGLGVYPYTRIGYSADAAAEAGLDFFTATRQAASDGVFETKDVPEGLARLVVATDGTVLGYQGLHYQADAMAKTMQVIIECGLSVGEIPDRAYHPTTPEILDGLLREASDAIE
jgi:dihydrolipoamide dehydrogenase